MSERKTKVCTRCKARRKIDAFRLRKDRSGNQRSSWCSACLVEVVRELRRRDAGVRRRNSEGTTRRRDALLTEIRELKAKTPCSDCGNQWNPWQMQFDHTGTDKVAGIADLVHSNSRKKVFEEIAKCELVCANCHANRTEARRATGCEQRRTRPAGV